MNREQMLRRRIRLLTLIFIVGLVLSGATAIPLRSEVDHLIGFFGLWDLSSQPTLPPLIAWIFKIRDALEGIQSQYPFLFYGTDWLAFGHFVIAIAFVGALRDPVRNKWLFDFGLIACALVIPYALILGGIRGIPLWWRMIDCSFGIIGFIPLWFCRQWAIELEQYKK